MKAPIVQSGALPGNGQCCAIGAFIGLHGKTHWKLWGPAVRLFS
jgi:hypothetical protein